MKQKQQGFILTYLRTLSLLLILLIPATFFLSFKTKNFLDVWQQLGITKEKGMENIRESFMNGYLHYYGIKNVRDIVLNDRAAIAKDLISYAKQYINSEAFKKQYEQERKSAKPSEPDIIVKTKEEIRSEKIAETEKSIKETEANIKKMTPDMAKAVSPVVDMLKNTLKDYKDPNSEMIELLYQGEKMNKESAVKSYEERLKNWLKNYPEDYRQFIKARLQKFIILARTVDFNAELKSVNGKRKFVNPAYEGKAYDWKQIFRAGKEVIEPSIAAAELWINELK